MQVLPHQAALFKDDTKRYFPNNTYNEGRTQRKIGKAFKGAVDYYQAKKKKELATAHFHNPVNDQFPTFRGSDNEAVDNGPTGELKGLYCKTPVLLSRFSNMLIYGILQDMLNRTDFDAITARPFLTFPDPDTLLADVTQADVDNVLGPLQ